MMHFSTEVTHVNQQFVVCKVSDDCLFAVAKCTCSFEDKFENEEVVLNRLFLLSFSF